VLRLSILVIIVANYGKIASEEYKLGFAVKIPFLNRNLAVLDSYMITIDRSVFSVNSIFISKRNPCLLRKSGKSLFQ